MVQTERVMSPSAYLGLLRRDDVKKLLAAYTQEKGQAGFETVFAEYSAEWGSEPSQTTIKKTAVDIGTDYMFVTAAQSSLYLHAAYARWVLLSSMSGWSCGFLKMFDSDRTLL